MRFELGREIIEINGAHGGWNIIEEGLHPQYYSILKIEAPYGIVRKDLAEAAIQGMNQFCKPNE